MSFKAELQELVGKYMLDVNVDRKSPDYLQAEYVSNCMSASYKIIKGLEDFYGVSIDTIVKTIGTWEKLSEDRL